MKLECTQLESRETPSDIPLLDPTGLPVDVPPDPVLVPLASVVGWAGALAPTTSVE